MHIFTVNVLKFGANLTRTNSADPDQTASSEEAV